MVFDAADDAYDRFMGRYSILLAPLFADFSGVEPGRRVLDVGAGPGALAAELARRGGTETVAAAEPSPRFVEALRRRLPGLEVAEAGAEELPWPDAEFDAALAQLVVSFMADPPVAVREMRRVVRPGGVVSLCMWDRDGMEMLSAIARARRAVSDTPAGDETLRYRTPDGLRDLLESAELRDIETGVLEVEREYSGYDEFWSALAGGVGPSGAWAASLDEAGRKALRDELHRQLGSPDGAFTLHARCNAARGTV